MCAISREAGLVSASGHIVFQSAVLPLGLAIPVGNGHLELLSGIKAVYSFTTIQTMNASQRLHMNMKGNLRISLSSRECLKW